MYTNLYYFNSSHASKLFKPLYYTVPDYLHSQGRFQMSYAGILSKCKKSPINQLEARNLMQLELLHYNHFREQKSGTKNMDLILDMHIFSWWTMVQRNVYHLTSLNFGQWYLNNLKVSTFSGDFLSFFRAEYRPHSHLKITTFFRNSVSTV